MPDIIVDIEANHGDIYAPDWEWNMLQWNVPGGEPQYTQDRDVARDTIGAFLSCGDAIGGHGFKFDLQGMKRAGIIDEYPDSSQVFDSMIGMNLIDENIDDRNLGLKPTVLRLYKHKMMTWKEASTGGFYSDKFIQYGLDDVVWERRYWDEYVRPLLHEKGLWKLYTRIYMPDLLYVCDEEETGVGWSLKRAATLLKIFSEIRAESEAKLRRALGDDINLRSTKQLTERLFGELGISTAGLPRTDKGAISLNKVAIEMLAKTHPVCGELLAYRNAEKMIGTYIKPNTERAIRNVDGRIHPNIWLTSKTGRKRQTDPNMANQPNLPDPRLNIRSCVIPKDGFRLVVGDLSQIELRFVAVESQDKQMLRSYIHWRCGACCSEGDYTQLLTHCPACGIEADERALKNPLFPGFWHGLDIHQNTADKLNVPRSPNAETKAAGKNCNFAMVYNATAWLMKEQFGTFTEEEWQEKINLFFEEYSGVKEWHVRLKHLMNDKRQVSDMFGRVRTIPEADLRKAWKHAYNMFVNFPIQCGSAHYLMLAKRAFRTEMRESGVWKRDVLPVNEIHDELVVEARNDCAEDVAELMKCHMRYAVDIGVPIDAEVRILDNWGGMKG